MSNQRTHHITTSDGVNIGGTVPGQGPPPVLLHRMLGDGDVDFGQLVQFLSDRFTCYLPSQRGRGLSGDHPDLSYQRQVEDYLAYIRSIGEPTSLVGWSGGAWPALDAARQSEAVAAVALVEPESVGLAEEDEKAAFGAAAARAGELASGGDLQAAVRPFADFVFNDEEKSELGESGYLGAVARYIPTLLSFLQQLMAFMEDGGRTADHPAVLGEVSSPVLVLGGSDTKPLASTTARHVVDHVQDGEIKEIRGAGHAVPLTHPEALASELTEFFASVRV